MNVLALPRDEFEATARELEAQGMDTTSLRRQYREASSSFSGVHEYAKSQQDRIANEGRTSIAGGLLSKPEGSTGMDAIRGLGFEPQAFVAGLLDAAARGVDAPRAASQGLIPAQDMIGEALGTAGVAMGGGGAAVAPKGAIGSNALRRQITTEPEFRPETFYHGTRSDIDAFDPDMVDLGVHVGTVGQANQRLSHLIRRDDPTYTGPFDTFENIKGQRETSAFRTGAGPAENSQILPLRVRADYPLRMPDAGEWDRSEVVMYNIEKMLEDKNADPRLVEAFEDFDFDGLDDARAEYYDNTDWKGSYENREFLDDIKGRIKDAGYDSIVYKNMVESSGAEGVQDSMIVLDPQNIRSVNAKFDPSREYSSDLLAANASKSAGLLGAAAGGGGGRGPNKRDLDPLGYQKTKMRGPLSEVDVNLRDAGENLERIPMSWESMEGKVVLPFYGDRTSRGLLVEGVNNQRFDQPVYTEGGVDFMRGPAAQADRAIWASDQGITKRLESVAEKAAQNPEFEGRDIVGVTGSMAPDANDFATFTGAAMAELVKGAPITGASAKKFDDVMRAVDPNFVGVLSPKLRDWATSASSENRKSFIRLMDSNPMQQAGFPSPAEARYAVTDPTQRDMPSGMFGLGAARVDTSAPRMYNQPKDNLPRATVPHSTYNTQMAGDYLGSLEPVPQGLLFRDLYDQMEGQLTKAGTPFTEAHKTYSLTRKMPAQLVTPQVVDGILEYLSRQGR